MLKVEYVRNGKYQIVGNKTSGFANGDTVARDRDGKSWAIRTPGLGIQEIRAVDL